MPSPTTAPPPLTFDARAFGLKRAVRRCGRTDSATRLPPLPRLRPTALAPHLPRATTLYAGNISRIRPRLRGHCRTENCTAAARYRFANNWLDHAYHTSSYAHRLLLNVVRPHARSSRCYSSPLRLLYPVALHYFTQQKKPSTHTHTCDHFIQHTPIHTYLPAPFPLPSHMGPSLIMHFPQLQPPAFRLLPQPCSPAACSCLRTPPCLSSTIRLSISLCHIHACSTPVIIPAPSLSLLPRVILAATFVVTYRRHILYNGWRT